MGNEVFQNLLSLMNSLPRLLVRPLTLRRVLRPLALKILFFDTSKMNLLREHSIKENIGNDFLRELYLLHPMVNGYSIAIEGLITPIAEHVDVTFYEDIEGSSYGSLTL